jgi:hypothetical protein
VEREDAKTIVRKLITVYGQSFLKGEDIKFFIDSWHDFLKDYDFDRVTQNLNEHVKNSEFAPKVKDLVKGLVMNEQYNIPNREETLKIIETYQKPEEQRATKEQRDKMRKDILGW